MLLIMMEISEENKKKGFEAESKFREWLEKHNIPYLYLQQDTQTISIAFKKYFSGKRPDFLLLIPISKVFESGRPIFTSSKSNMNFYAVSPREFVQIADDDSLDRLLSKFFIEETKN